MGTIGRNFSHFFARLGWSSQGNSGVAKRIIFRRRRRSSSLMVSYSKCTKARTQSVGLAVCPCPVTSSARNTSPAPKVMAVPSPRPISTEPERVMTHWRRGAGCQSKRWGRSCFLNTRLVTGWKSSNSLDASLVSNRSK
jgi:hypothetical protein